MVLQLYLFLQRGILFLLNDLLQQKELLLLELHLKYNSDGLLWMIMNYPPPVNICS